MEVKLQISLPFAAKTATPVQGLAIKTPVLVSRYGDSETHVTISDAARRAAENDGVQKTAKAEAPAMIRDLLEDVDFRNITPRQMAVLGGKLFERGYFPMQSASAFNGTELNTLVERDPNQPIDMIEHFRFMLDGVKEAVRSDRTLSYGLSYWTNAVEALERLVSYTDTKP